MQRLIFVIGATAAGKSYFIEQRYQNTDVDILNIYDYQQRAYDEAGAGEFISFDTQFRCLMKANNMLLEDILDRLSQGHDVVVEQTFYKAKRRIAYIDEIRKKAEVYIEVYVMNPSDSLWESNIRKRDLGSSLEYYKSRAADFEFPNIAEGMDAVYEVVDGEVRPRMEQPKPDILEAARKELKEEAERIRNENEKRENRQKLLDSMKERPFWHYCEVCGKKEFITAEEAFQAGWDYPPNIGHFGVLGPRTCGECGIVDTLFWKIHSNGKLPIVCDGDLTPEELVTWKRIKGEPESLLTEE